MARTLACGLPCFLIVWVLSWATYGAEYHVNWDESGDFILIQDAIDASVTGDVLIVHPGTYYENIHFDGKNITLRSLDPEDEEIVASTVIDGQQKGSVVTFAATEDETCMLSGFTITNGSSDYGGGIMGCDPDSQYMVCTHAGIGNCVVEGNSASWAGGGLCGSAGKIFNCMINGNSVMGEGGGLESCYGPISNCTVSGNRAEYGNGGGLCSCYGLITDCVISGNSAAWEYGWGGGVCGCAAISNCVVSDNWAGEWGGGVAYCPGTVRNCTVWGNSAAHSGGGLYNCYGRIVNCTITANSAGEDGGGLSWCDWRITGCIVWGNDAPNGRELFLHEDAVITYSCVRGWTGGGEGNIADDPLFVSGPLGDYYLSSRAAGQGADSPCIDAGNGTARSLGLDTLTTRTDEVPDIGIVDMGYHYPLTLPQNPQIECSLNSGEFSPGQTLVGFIQAHNPGPDVTVDAYIGFVLPDGAMISLTGAGLATGIYPWMSNVMLPSGFDFGPSEVVSATVPAGPGNCLFAAALALPGRLDFIGEPSLFAFRITD